jgi:uncharacterized tellurite resistance protein B-like protein
MEVIGTLILMWIGIAVVRAIISGVGKAGKAAVRAAQGKDPEYFGALEMRLKEETLEGLEDKPFYRVSIRGQTPVTTDQEISISVIARDVGVEDNEGNRQVMPMISLVEDCQEAATICYEKRHDLNISEGYWTSWVELATVAPFMLQPPYSGERTIEVSVVIYENNGGAEFNQGLLSRNAEILRVLNKQITHVFEETGYSEESENQKECLELAIKIGISVAMADGTLDDSEGVIIQKYMQKNLDTMSESREEEMRPRLNAALKEGFARAEIGDLSFSPLCARLAEIGARKSKYDVIELCMDVMAADGVADESELKIISAIADAIDFDMTEITRMKDERMVSANIEATEQNTDALLGIDEAMTTKEKQRQLRVEFQKWNDRINALDSGPDRDNAQRMLDLISEARKRLDS